jgi:hypothetical protein
MSVLTDLQEIRADYRALREIVNAHQEQINGDRGLSKGLAAVAEEIRSLKRAIWIVGAGIVASAVGFCFTVLQVFGGPG